MLLLITIEKMVKIEKINKSGDSNSTKEFNTLSKNIKNNLRVDQSLNIQSHDSNLNELPTTIRL